MMPRRHWTDGLTALNACSDAVTWARGYPTLAAAWTACHRSDWMLWLLRATGQGGERGSPERARLVLCAADIAEWALPHIREPGPSCRYSRDEIEAICVAAIQTARAVACGCQEPAAEIGRAHV
jgi:hypothetical protein